MMQNETSSLQQGFSMGTLSRNPSQLPPPPRRLPSFPTIEARILNPLFLPPPSLAPLPPPPSFNPLPPPPSLPMPLQRQPHTANAPWVEAPPALSQPRNNQNLGHSRQHVAPSFQLLCGDNQLPSWARFNPYGSAAYEPAILQILRETAVRPSFKVQCPGMIHQLLQLAFTRSRLLPYQPCLEFLYALILLQQSAAFTREPTIHTP